jgi:cellulose biosynthesis protein BcsQ
VTATEQTLRLIGTTRESRPGRKPASLLVPNRVDPQLHHHWIAEAGIADMAERWAPVVREDADHAEAVATGQWTGHHAPDSPATTDILALADALEEHFGIERRRPVAAAPVAPAKLPA